MPELRITLPAPHPGQQRVLDNAKRFNVVSCGRRWGKTQMAQLLLITASLPGAPVSYFCPTFRMLSEVWRAIIGTLRPFATRVSEEEHRIELVSGGTIDFWSLDAGDATRGRKNKRVVIDEAGLDPNLLEHWNGAIRPTLTDLRGDAWFLSTPRLSGFDQLCQRAESGDWEGWAYFEAPTSDNPYISTEEIASARQDMPEAVFAREFLAKRGGDVGRVFRFVREAAVAQWQHEAVRGHTYAVGIDWGKLDDYSVFSVVDCTLREQCFLERFNQIDYHLQIGRLRILCEKFKPGIVVAERNAIGEPVIEMAVRMKIPVWPWTATNQSVALVVEGLSLAFERRLLKILPVPVQLAELEQFTTERLPSGLLRYAAPEGVHDDVVRALCLSWLAACQPSGRIKQREFAVVTR
jgi:hypothetical protein